MATSVRYKVDRVESNADVAALKRIGTLPAFWQAVSAAPHAFDWFFVMRWQEARAPTLPRFGRAGRAADEPLRIGQKPSLLFAPAAIASVNLSPSRPPTLLQYGFGLFGANGPMPLHLTELVYEREMHGNDRAMARFADIFHHRAGMLFYRAWADAQSTVGLDRPRDDHYSRYMSSIIGYGAPSQRDRDAVPDHAKRYFAGHMVRESRNREGLEKVLSLFFRIPTQLLQWQFNWMHLDPDQRTRLGERSENARLGSGATIGAKHPDRQHKFRLRLGGMSFAQYQAFLPKQRQFTALIDWVRNYCGFEFAWDAQLVLAAQEVPQPILGKGAQLGWTTWIGTRAGASDADDLIIQPEHYVNGPGVIRAAP